MTKREIALLCFKIFGAYFVIMALIAIPDAIIWPLFVKATTGPKSPPLWIELFTILGPMSLELLLGLLVWRNAGRLASGILGDGEAASAETPPSVQVWMAAGFFLIGMYLVVQAISSLVGIAAYNWGVQITNLSGSIGLLSRHGPGQLSGRLAGEMGRLIVGLLLIANSYRAASYIARSENSEEART